MTPHSRQMVGRDAELTLLTDVAAEARAGEVRLALITGEAGIGKSRLVAELVRSLDDALVLHCHGVAMDTGEIPFGLVAELLRDLQRQAPDALTDAERQVLHPLLPGAHRGASSDRVALLAAGLALLERLAEDRMVCWVIEDLHWADAATKDLLNLVVRGVSNRHLLAVATLRTDDLERPPHDEQVVSSYAASLARLPQTTTIRLGRLARAEVDRLIADHLDEHMPTVIAHRIADLSDGIPFVVEELVAAGGRPEMSTVASVATARLALLPDDARRLVEAAAVGVGQLDCSLVQDVVDLDPGALDTAIRAAIEAGILAEGSGDTLMFRHALLRDAVDRSLTPPGRRSWHRRWAEALVRKADSGDRALLAIAEHWFQAGDERALEATLTAALVARRLNELTVEHRLWRRAIDLWPKGATTVAGCSWRDCVARCCEYGWNGQSDLDLNSSLLKRVEDPGLVTFLQQQRLAVLRAKGEPPRMGEQDLVHAVETLHAGPADMVQAGGLLVAAGSYDVEDERGERLLDEAEAVYAALGDARGRIAVLAHRSARLQAAGRVDVAADLLEAALTDPALGMGLDLWWLDGNLIWALATSGRHDEIEPVYERARGRVAEPRAAAMRWEHVVENVSASWTETGQWQRATDLILENRPYCGESLTSSDLRLARLVLLRTGLLPDAASWVDSLNAPDTPGGPSLVERAHLVAQHGAAAKDPVLLRQAADAIWENADLTRNSDLLWAAVRDMARAEFELGAPGHSETERRTAASRLEHIAEVASHLTRSGRLGEVWPLELEALLAASRGDQSVELLEQTRAGWEGIGHVYDAATCHLLIGQMLASRGDRRRATDHAEAAADVARKLGAAPLLKRADDLLARLGARGAPSSGLTAREVEVLALVAAGRTNEQIAATLFMSPKTASVHVSHIIAKLGATNRTEAAALGRARALV